MIYLKVTCLLKVITFFLVFAAETIRRQIPRCSLVTWSLHLCGLWIRYVNSVLNYNCFPNSPTQSQILFLAVFQVYFQSRNVNGRLRLGSNNLVYYSNFFLTVPCLFFLLFFFSQPFSRSFSQLGCNRPTKPILENSTIATPVTQSSSKNYVYMTTTMMMMMIQTLRF